MPLHQITVTDSETGRQLATVEHETDTDVQAYAAARDNHNFVRDPEGDETEPQPVPPERLDMEAVALEPERRYTVEASLPDADGNYAAVAVREVTAESPADAEQQVIEVFSVPEREEGPAVDAKAKAIAYRDVYPDSIIPPVNQAGPRPL